MTVDVLWSLNKAYNYYGEPPRRNSLIINATYSLTADLGWWCWYLQKNEVLKYLWSLNKACDYYAEPLPRNSLIISATYGLTAGFLIGYI